MSNPIQLSLLLYCTFSEYFKKVENEILSSVKSNHIIIDKENYIKEKFGNNKYNYDTFLALSNSYTSDWNELNSHNETLIKKEFKAMKELEFKRYVESLNFYLNEESKELIATFTCIKNYNPLDDYHASSRLISLYEATDDTVINVFNILRYMNYLSFDSTLFLKYIEKYYDNPYEFILLSVKDRIGDFPFLKNEFYALCELLNIQISYESLKSVLDHLLLNKSCPQDYEINYFKDKMPDFIDIMNKNGIDFNRYLSVN